MNIKYRICSLKNMDRKELKNSIKLKLKNNRIRKIFTNLNIKKKLFLGFGAVILLLTISAFISIRTFNYFSASISDFTQYSIPLTNLSLNASNNLVSARNNIQKAVNAKTTQEIEFNLKSAKDHLSSLPDDIDMLENKYRGEKRDVELIKYNVSLLMSTRESLFNLLSSDKNSSNVIIIKEQYDKNSNLAEERLRKISDNIVTYSNQYLAIQKIYEKKSILTIVLMSAIIIILASVICIILSSLIIGPIHEIRNAFREFSKGNLDTPVDYDSTDEIGELCLCFRETSYSLKRYIQEISYILNKMAAGNLDLDADLGFKGDFVDIEDSLKTILESLNTTMHQINISSDRVAGGAYDVSEGAQNLSHGAACQSDASKSLSAAVLYISDKTEQNTQNTKDALKFVESAGENIKKSDENMKKMIVAMEDIKVKSAEVNKIIKTIEDIAFHTDILAINAAIESARAGEFGRGFYIVANEVRSLALKSAEAARSTSFLINQTVNSIENGFAIAENTDKSVAAVVNDAQEIRKLVSSISDSTQEQSLSVKEITQDIAKISQVIHSNSEASTESALSSCELSLQADHLKQLVMKFNLCEIKQIS